MLTAPASGAPPTSLKGTPTARSANPSPLKSPVASAQPKLSPEASVAEPVPVSSQNWFEVADNPFAEPYRTFTPPVSVAEPTSSPGTPTARSA